MKISFFEDDLSRDRLTGPNLGLTLLIGKPTCSNHAKRLSWLSFQDLDTCEMPWKSVNLSTGLGSGFETIPLSHLHMGRIQHTHRARKANDHANSCTTLRARVPSIYLGTLLYTQALMGFYAA